MYQLGCVNPLTTLVSMMDSNLEHINSVLNGGERQSLILYIQRWHTRATNQEVRLLNCTRRNHLSRQFTLYLSLCMSMVEGVCLNYQILITFSLTVYQCLSIQYDNRFNMATHSPMKYDCDTYRNLNISINVFHPFIHGRMFTR